MQVVRIMLHEAQVVSATSARLIETLSEASGIALSHKACLSPNMAEEVRFGVQPRSPEALVIAASGSLPLTRSHDAFADGVRRFLRRHELPVVLIGAEASELVDGIPNTTSLGMLSYFTYLEFLRMGSFLAIAPLEGRGDLLTQRFIDSKSDIKMVEYSSCGVPAVYSDVTPYRRSPIEGNVLADMGDAQAVEDGLSRAFARAHEIRQAAAESVREHRLAESCVRSTWAHALTAARLPAPVAMDNVMDAEAKYAALMLAPHQQLELLSEANRLHETLAGISPLTSGLKRSSIW